MRPEQKVFTKLKDTLLEALKSSNLNNHQNKTSRRIENSPWVKLPNCQDFQIKLHGWNPILKFFNLKKKITPTIEIEPYINGKMNRYMEHQVLRLKKLRAQPRLYWKLSKFLISKSHVFRIAAWHHVFPNWHRNLPLKQVLIINNQVNSLIKKWEKLEIKLEYSRVLIPKGTSDVRPLGVPKAKWRILLHMWNNFLTWYITPRLLSTQHGFIPTRGCLTAWKDLFQKRIIESKYIYECDLKQFFPSVDIKSISKQLQEWKIPDSIIVELEQLNISTPSYPAVGLLPEFENWFYDWCAKSGENLRMDSMKLIEKGWDVWSRSHTDDGLPILRVEDLEAMFNLREYKYPPYKIIDQLFINPIPPDLEYSYQGVPQGSPTSPILSITTLKDFLSQQPSISYADDPIFYGNKPFEIKDEPNKGINLHETKSGWVKYNGKWLKPLKYLGMEYDGTTLRAHTRRGSALEVGSNIKQAIRSIRQYEQKNYTGMINTMSNSRSASLVSWQEIFSSKLIGYIQSRLYQGDWELKDLHQDFNLSYIPGSWYSKKKGNVPFASVFNTSSYASLSLYNIFRRSKIRKPKQGQTFKKFRWTLTS